MKEKARSAEGEMDAIFSKKVEIRNKINKMNGTRVYEELNLRFQQRTLLEICISAHDAGEDHRTFTQSMVEQVRMLENDMDELDRQLDALNEEEKSLAEELEFAQGSHLGVVEVIDALYSELNGRYCWIVIKQSEILLWFIYSSNFFFCSMFFHFFFFT